MLKCPNCGTDNMLTAIFCRGCGQKIDLNAIKPEAFEKVETKKGANTAMQNLIGGIIIGVLLIGFLVGLFFPSCDKISTTEESRAAALKKFDTIGMDKGSPVEVTDEDISNFVTAKLLALSAVTGNPRPTGATVHCLPDNKVKIVASGKYCGLPISLTVEGTVQLDSSSRRISVHGEKCSVGLFPLPQGLEQSFLGPFRTNFNNAMDDINGFKVLKTDDGKASLVRGKVKKPAGMPGDMMPPGGM